MKTVHKLFDLDHQVALVTGGAGFLGEQFCHALAEAGARVVVADIADEGAQAVAQDLKGQNGDALAVHLDVTDPASVQEAVNVAVKQYGTLDILVNSAAMDPKFDPQHADQHRTSFEEYPLPDWKEALDVNLTGMFLTCQAAARVMKQKGRGSIINICSMYGLVGPDQRIYESLGDPKRYKPVYYTVSKAGVLGLTRYIATYYAGTEVRCNALTPGGIENQHQPAFEEAYSYRAVMGRMGQPHELKGAIVFLASEASSYMTGANLIVDGGWTAW